MVLDISEGWPEPYTTVYLVSSLPNTLYTHRI